MLWSNVSEFYLLCLIYAPHAKHYPQQIQHFIFLILLKLKIMSISSLSSSSTVQHTINNSSTHVYEHFEFIFVAFVTLVNTYFDKKIIATKGVWRGGFWGFRKPPLTAKQFLK